MANDIKTPQCFRLEWANFLAREPNSKVDFDRRPH